jgi:hypothetical protein
MPIQIDGSQQKAQQQSTLNSLTQEAGNFANQARRVTRQISEFLRMHKASGMGPDIGAASASEYLTGSSSSVTVEMYRKMLKAACSYSVVIGDMTQSEADTLLQEAYGNSSETTVPADQISALTDQWV